MTLLQSLYQPLSDHDLHLVPMTETHRESLRTACAEDTEIWDIYPTSFLGEHFDGSFAEALESQALLPYVILIADAVVGMTAWHDSSENKQSTHIGMSYLAPRLRGTGLNRRIKQLMIDHAVAVGFRRIALTVDARNTRSQRAVEKIGGVREGVLRADRITWTGHVRDTVMFSILADEWKAKQS
jgi:RimJ/RimL family protein N-acetyltransferase